MINSKTPYLILQLVPTSQVYFTFKNQDQEPRIFAVNSYDNVMRVYDRGTGFSLNSFELMHALKGYKNKNWPIRSSFYKLRDGIIAI